MSGGRLAIITTRLPPATCGIGTYSGVLQEHWPNEQSSVHFLVMEGVGENVTAFNGSGTELASNLDRIGASDVLLHYAGRAFQRFGCPTWLPPALENWKRKFPGSRLAIFFHELPGNFPITSRHFWLGKINAGIIRRLASTADVIMTNTGEHVRQLREISGRDDIQFFPVGSNIESVAHSFSPRARTEFLLFGLPFGRWQTLQLFASHIHRWQAHGRLTKLHLVGPQDDEFSKRADGLVDDNLVIRHGTLPSPQVSELLHRVGFALTNASEKTWSKSTAFMAAAAHACPVVIASLRSETVPLSYAIAADEVATIPDDELTRRAIALAAWYRANADWPIAAQRMAALL